jgi:hypothetical protein
MWVFSKSSNYIYEVAKVHQVEQIHKDNPFSVADQQSGAAHRAFPRTIQQE